jgi:hypothetical protein
VGFWNGIWISGTAYGFLDRHEAILYQQRFALDEKKLVVPFLNLNQSIPLINGIMINKLPV